MIPSLQYRGWGQFLGLCPPNCYRPTLTPAHQGSLDLGPASAHWCTRPFCIPCSDQAIGLFLATGDPWLERDGELVVRPTFPPVRARPALSNAVLFPSCQEGVHKVLLGNVSVLPVASVQSTPQATLFYDQGNTGSVSTRPWCMLAPTESFIVCPGMNRGWICLPLPVPGGPVPVVPTGPSSPGSSCYALAS